MERQNANDGKIKRVEIECGYTGDGIINFDELSTQKGVLKKNNINHNYIDLSNNNIRVCKKAYEKIDGGINLYPKISSECMTYLYFGDDGYTQADWEDPIIRMRRLGNPNNILKGWFAPSLMSKDGCVHVEEAVAKNVIISTEFQQNSSEPKQKNGDKSSTSCYLKDKVYKPYYKNIIKFDIEKLVFWSLDSQAKLAIPTTVCDTSDDNGNDVSNTELADAFRQSTFFSKKFENEIPFTCGTFVKKSDIDTRPMRGVYFNEKFVKVMFRHLLNCIKINFMNKSGSIQWDYIRVALVEDISQHHDTYKWKPISEIDNMPDSELNFYDYYKPFEVKTTEK